MRGNVGKGGDRGGTEEGKWYRRWKVGRGVTSQPYWCNIDQY